MFSQRSQRVNQINCRYGTDKVVYHSYGPIYDEIVETFVRRPLLNPAILEIGVMTGAFVHIMRELFRTSYIEAIDIDFSLYSYGGAQDLIVKRKVDATQPGSPSGMYFDLIVDDASHDPEDQKKTFHLFSPYVKKGGFYVIEDIKSNDHRDYYQQLADEQGFELKWHDLTWKTGMSDDRIACFKKTSSA
jgi:hypothetical protein